MAASTAACNHFWTKSFPKLKRGQKLDVSKLPGETKGKFAGTVDTIERFVNLSVIALGLL